MTAAPPRKRRPEARPGEILAAALDLFAANGFAATRMDDVAARAGLSKAAIYLYFPDKTALLAAVVKQAVAGNFQLVEASIAAHPGPAGALLEMLLHRMAGLMRETRLPDLAKLVIAESRAQPEIGRLWLEHVIDRALPLIAGLIARGVAAGEFRAVDPGLTARCVVGPMLLAALWRSVFEPLGAETLDIAALAAQHAALMRRALEPDAPEPPA